MKEVLRWCVTACPNKLKAQAADTKIKLIQRHVIINEMLHHGILMLPATMDPFSCEGPALHWFKFAHPSSVFHTTDHSFGKEKGSAVGKEMCCQKTQEDYIKELLLKTDKHWKVVKPEGKLFGETYIDTTPTAWNQQHLATHFTWEFAQHVLYCTRRHNRFSDTDAQEDIAITSVGYNKN
eukprot:3558102-Ditylum_brightwellii.AAC.1